MSKENRFKLEVGLLLLALLGLLSLPVSAMVDNVNIFLYGYTLCFPFLIYHIVSKRRTNG